VAIARALITKPDVVFADEPTGMLDSASGREVLGLLRGLLDGQRQTVIMVSHDPLAASHADRVVFLADGRLSGELHAPTPQSIAADYANGVDASGGTVYSVRTFDQDTSLATGTGWDQVTGLGTLNGAVIGALAAAAP